MPAAGDPIYASHINLLHARRRGQTTTPKTGVTTTETGFMRLDDVPVYAGEALMIVTPNVNLDSNTNNDSMTARLRVAFSASPGTPATTASTQIGVMRQTSPVETQSAEVPLIGFYYPASDGYISLLLSFHRTAGSGTVQWFASSTEICHLVVRPLGDDPGDSAVLL